MSLTEQTCPNCDDGFTPRRWNQRYCSPGCQKLAGNQRLKDGCTMADYVIAQHETRHAPEGSDDAETCRFARRELARLTAALIRRNRRLGRPPAKLRVAQMAAEDGSVIDRIAAE